VRFEDEKVSKILKLPKQLKPIGIITLGYPAEKLGRFERIDLTEIVYYERYGNSS
jgi:nitroreductase